MKFAFEDESKFRLGSNRGWEIQRICLNVLGSSQCGNYPYTVWEFSVFLINPCCVCKYMGWELSINFAPPGGFYPIRLICHMHRRECNKSPSLDNRVMFKQLLDEENSELIGENQNCRTNCNLNGITCVRRINTKWPGCSLTFSMVVQ